MKLFAAFAVAPISPGIVVAILALFGPKPDEAIWGIKFNMLIGYPTAVIFGVPAYYVMNRAGFHKARHYILAGGIAGCVLCIVTLTFGLLLLGALFGAFAGFVFWCIARPDASARINSGGANSPPP